MKPVSLPEKVSSFFRNVVYCVGYF